MSETRKFTLLELMAADAEGSVMPVVHVAEAKKAIKARMIARAYVRNGMNLHKAYKTVTGFTGLGTINKLCKGHVDDFVDELKTLVEASQVDQQAALNFLWEMIHTSLLDYFDENGRVLPIKELKKLPRIMQQIIEEVEVKSQQSIVVDPETGKVMVDDNGRPYLKTDQFVKIKLPPKLMAMDQLAKIMKWIGPNVVINNNTTNIGILMGEKAARIRQLNEAYAGEKIIEGEVVRQTPRPPESSGTKG